MEKNRTEFVEAGAVEGLVDILMKRDAGVDEPLGIAAHRHCAIDHGDAFHRQI